MESYGQEQHGSWAKDPQSGKEREQALEEPHLLQSRASWLLVDRVGHLTHLYGAILSLLPRCLHMLKSQSIDDGVRRFGLQKEMESQGKSSHQ